MVQTCPQVDGLGRFPSRLPASADVADGERSGNSRRRVSSPERFCAAAWKPPILNGHSCKSTTESDDGQGSASPVSNARTGRGGIAAVSKETQNGIDAASGTICVWIGFPGKRYFSIAPNGSFFGSSQIERELLSSAQTKNGQVTLTLDEFSSKYGWKNDSELVPLMTK